MANSIIDDMLKNQIPNEPKKKGSKVFIVLIIILMMIIALAVVAIFILKNQNKLTPKEAFLQYLGKGNISNVLNFEKLNYLNTRIQEESAEATMDVTGDFSGPFDTDVDFTKIKVETLSKNDPTTEHSYSELALKYNDNDIISFNTLSSSNKIGIISDDIIVKYVGCKYSNLSDVLNRIFSSNEDSVTFDLVDFDQLKNTSFTLPQISNDMFAKYIDIINQKVSNEAFSVKKITLDRSSGKIDVTEYSMSFNESQAIELLDQMLQTLENDDALLDMILAPLGETEEIKETIRAQIEAYISSLYEVQPDNSKVYTVKVYGANDVTYKVTLDFAGNNTVDVDYEYKENANSMTITFLETETQNGYSLEFVKTTTDVSENLNLAINMIQESQIVGKLNIISNLVSSRKFIYLEK